MATRATAKKRSDDITPRLRVVRDREQALSHARAARRKLESRQEQGGDRFAHLRRSHD